MVFIDNAVALRQLEVANAALLSQTNSRTYEGKSLAKDGKIHPRVLTLVGVALVVLLVFVLNTYILNREGTTRSHYHYFVVSLAYMAQSGQCVRAFRDVADTPTIV